MSNAETDPDGRMLLGEFIEIHRTAIISTALQANVPAVFQRPLFVKEGGLVSYGADFRDIFHRAAGYVDRILRGAKPAELPVQMPVKYLLVINLKTAHALGLTVPQSILLSADDVIE